MEQLIRFLMRYGVYFLFVVLEAFSFIVIVNQNSFQHAAFYSSSNRIAGAIYSAGNSVVEYFGLTDVNRQLSAENIELKNRVVRLEALLASAGDTLSHTPYILADKDYQYIEAKVINNSVNKLQNFITLNKGRRDGVMPEMGVVTNEGIVGVVSASNDRYSTVLPLLNPKSHISCKIKRSRDFGQLTWDGIDPDYVQLDEVPRHGDVRVGDTIVTTGYSSIFPEGIRAGIVSRCSKPANKTYVQIDIKAGVSFRTVSYVKVVKFNYIEDLKAIEKEGTK
jgi:rod shape-determining protein MreC